MTLGTFSIDAIIKIKCHFVLQQWTSSVDPKSPFDSDAPSQDASIKSNLFRGPPPRQGNFVKKRLCQKKTCSFLQHSQNQEAWKADSQLCGATFYSEFTCLIAISISRHFHARIELRIANIRIIGSHAQNVAHLTKVMTPLNLSRQGASFCYLSFEIGLDPDF